MPSATLSLLLRLIFSRAGTISKGGLFFMLCTRELHCIVHTTRYSRDKFWNPKMFLLCQHAGNKGETGLNFRICLLSRAVRLLSPRCMVCLKQAAHCGDRRKTKCDLSRETGGNKEENCPKPVLNLFFFLFFPAICPVTCCMSRFRVQLASE